MDTTIDRATTQGAVLVLPLAAAEATLERVGGKGAALARLARAGLPVPPGFHVTTEAYRRFVAANGLHTAIVTAASDAPVGEPDFLERAAARIQALFAGGALPDDVARAIRQAYTGLGDGVAVAVRSSATAEDLPELSFAGQHESYLNVRGEAAVLDAIRRCWASLWTARALGYRARAGIPPEDVSLAVVVQELVPADVAGVLFTADPVTGARDQVRINAAWGLGEAIVGGLVTPDSLMLDKGSGAILAREIADKTVMTMRAADGTRTDAVPEERRRAAVLRPEQVADLMRLAREIEQLWGQLMDIEWAMWDGQIFVVQARPITSLPAPPLEHVRWEPPYPGSAWIRRQVAENMPEPLSPLFDELYVRQGLERSLDVLMEALYARAMPWLRLEDMFDRPLFTTVNGYAYQRANFKVGLRVFLHGVRGLDAGVKVLRDNALPHWRDRALPGYQATIARWKQVDPTSATDEQLLVGIRDLALADAEYWFACAVVMGAAKFTDGLLDRFLAIAAPRSGLTSGLFLRGFPSPTLEAEAELEELAERIRASEGLRAVVAGTPAAELPSALRRTPDGLALLADFERYLDCYGHQIYNLDFAVPTQADDPLPVLLSLKAMAHQRGRDVRARQREIARARDERLAAVGRSLDPIRGRLFCVLLGWAQRYGPYREQALFYLGAGWPTLRRLALELGRRLTQAGTLTTSADIFFLVTGEIERASTAGRGGRAKPELAWLARERRDLREARKRLHPPAAVPPSYTVKFGPLDLSRFETQHREQLGDGALLRGFAVSPGRITAPASLICSPAEFGRMAPGSILVCPTTTPAWTPLFAQARGLVTDMGGILAHGSIVAREYGIPAVMGTGSATARIAHGQVITVDGDLGRVHIQGPHTGST